MSLYTAPDDQDQCDQDSWTDVRWEEWDATENWEGPDDE